MNERGRSRARDRRTNALRRIESRADTTGGRLYFSGLSNLRHITISSKLSSICGYTEGELQSVFPEWLPGLDRDAAREWYSGYSWTGEPVYSPFDVLLLAERQFRPWWFEGYYASVFYSYFAAQGYEVVPDDATNKGRIDLTVKARGAIWIFELKVKGVDRSGEAHPLEQLLSRGYADSYRADARPVRQIGVVFDPKERNIEAWEVAE